MSFTTLTFVCEDGSQATARFIIDINNDTDIQDNQDIQDFFGPVIGTHISIANSNDIRIQVHEHEFPNAATTEPLMAYLESFGNVISNEFFSVAKHIESFPDAVRCCYEAACERLDIPYFVKKVELEIVTMLTDGIEVPRAFIGNPRIDAITANHNAIIITHMIRGAVEKYSAIVIILKGGTRAIASFNMKSMDDETFWGSLGLLGGKKWLKWMLTSKDDPEPEMPAEMSTQRHLVYSGNTKPADFDETKIQNGTVMGMDEPEGTFDCIIGRYASNANMKLVMCCEDVLRICGHYHMDVDAIVGYEDEDNDQVNTLVYARNGWRDKVWKSEK